MSNSIELAANTAAGRHGSGLRKRDAALTTRALAWLLTGLSFGVLGCAQGSKIPSDRFEGLGSLLDGGNPNANADSGAQSQGGASGALGTGDAAVAKPPQRNDAGGDVLGDKDAGNDAAAAISCDDGERNGLETGIDCGGLCAACPDAGKCTPATCAATECGSKPDGCGKTLSCTYVCATGTTCNATTHACEAPAKTCNSSMCPPCLNPLTGACCKSDKTCGCALLGFLGCT